jgi:hypothetical protein
VLLTGVDDLDLSQHATAVGADAVLSKPCHADLLLDQVLASASRSPHLQVQPPR